MNQNIKGLIDKERVLTLPEDLVTYSYDATEKRGTPKAVFRPINEEEIIRIVRYAAQNNLSLTPRGAGTGLAGSAVPCDGGLVIDFSLMSGIKKIDRKNRLVTAEPGVVYADLNRALEDFGLFFPPDPGSGKVCTLGGMVSTNASGIRAVKYGTTRNYVQKLRVVLGTGEVVKLGNLAPKSSSGYDLVGFFVGSEGTLGIITEITLKLREQPDNFAAAKVSFRSMEDAGRAVVAIIKKGLMPSVLEIIDESTIKVINMFRNIDIEGKAVLLMEMDGFSDGDVRYRLNQGLDICRDNKSEDTVIASTQESREALWEARKAALPSLARYRPTLILEDISVPISKLPMMIKKIDELSKKHKIEIATFGHAGDGNIHPTMLVDKNDPEEMKQVKLAMNDLFKATLALNGTLTGEHGIGLSKKEFMHLEHESTLELMKKLKKVFDPNGILNPGKIF